MSSRAWACHVNARVPLKARRVWDVLSSSPVSGAVDATRCATRAALVLRILRPGRPPWRPRLGLRVEVGTHNSANGECRVNADGGEAEPFLGGQGQGVTLTWALPV